MTKEITIKKAAVINALTKYSVVIVNLLTNMLLARILNPEDYGVVAVITVFSTFFMIFSDMGVSSAIIHEGNLTEEEITDIFSWMFYIGGGLSILFLLFSELISLFYGNKIYNNLGLILCFSIFFSALNMVPNGLLLKEKKFIYLGTRNIIAAIFNFAVTYILAYRGFKAYSIVWGTTVHSASLFFMNILNMKIKFRLRPGIQGIKKIFSFSFYQFSYMLVNYFSRNLDNLLTGKVLGESALGYYDKAYKLTLYPISNFTQVISQVLHPILTAHRKEYQYIYKKYVNVVELLAAVGLYFTTVCWFGAKEIVIILYGNNWLASVPCFKILSLTIGVQMVSSSAGAIYQSLGNTKMMFKSGLSYMVITIFCISLGLIGGNIQYLAGGVAVAMYAKFFIEYYFLIKKCLGCSLLVFYKVFLPYIVSMFVAMGALLVNNLLILEIINPIMSLLEISIVAFVSYTLSLILIGKIKYLKKNPELYSKK